MIISTALIFFFVANPIGNAPAIIAMVKDFDLKQQRRILTREVIIALFLAIFFQFFGELFFMKLLHVKNYTTNITGGILLSLTALEMIFPRKREVRGVEVKKEPYIVPIATPLLSGPGLLTIIMLKSTEVGNNLVILSAILIAWIGVVIVLLAAPYLQKVLKQRGMIALEQLMGMIVIMMAIQMIVKGVQFYQGATL